MWESSASKIWESSSFAKEQYSMLYKTTIGAFPTDTAVAAAAAALSSSSSKKKKKKGKNSSNKPLNSYAAFYRDNFEMMRAENPELNVQDIAKLIGARWKADTVARERYGSIRRSQLAAFDDGSGSSKSKTPKKPRKKKDPNAPSKPLNPYASFYRDNFEQLRSENPDLNVQEIAKLMGAKWKSDTAARERYGSLRKSQLAESSSSSAAVKVDENGVPIPTPPKKPLNSYAAYYRDNFEAMRQENPGLNVQEIAKLIGSRWKADTAGRERYGMIRKAQMATYNEEHGLGQGYENCIGQVQDGNSTPGVTQTGPNAGLEMPKKPLNAFASYCQDHFESIRSENPGLSAKEISKIAGFRWKADTASRKKYNIIYKAQMNAYKERPPPPFNSYYQDIFETLRAQNPDLDVLALTKLADSMWKADTATKEKYTMLYKIQLQAYYEKLKQSGLFNYQQNQQTAHQ